MLLQAIRISRKRCHIASELSSKRTFADSVKITNVNMTERKKTQPITLVSDSLLVDSLLEYTELLTNKNASNLIAFSGGVDSSLVAYLVHRVFHQSAETFVDDNSSLNGSVQAILGVSSALPQSQIQLARSVASHIGIDLKEIRTKEGLDPTYIENKGKSCYVCKNHLYSALEAVVTEIDRTADRKKSLILFNGTNADDIQDPTRLGILAAKSFSVRSPLEFTTKDDVRRASRHVGLPNWNFASSPCLRSRLALGVEATEQNLLAIDKAEKRVRELLQIDETINMRVRMLSGRRAMLELDEKILSMADTNFEQFLRTRGVNSFFKELGFTGELGVRPFKSGSVSKR